MKLRKRDRTQLIIQSTFWLLVLAAGISAAIIGSWLNVAIAIIALILSFLPSIFERRFRIDLPSEFELMIILGLFLSLYLGELQNFYQVFWWWDLFLHALSGVILGIVGFTLVYILNAEKTTLKLSPLFIAIFAASFAICFGVLWEIFEFAIDQLLGFNMQKSGLVDTMWDLMVDVFGAFLVSTIGYFYIKRDPKFVKKLKKRFS